MGQRPERATGSGRARVSVFISYRRSDTEGYARGLYEAFRRRMSADQIFMDVDTIRGGEQWVDEINRGVAACDAFLAIIGPRWLERDDAGARRLDQEGDHVRLEIESALTQNKRVIPVLVGGGRMPRGPDLPASLAVLAHLQAVTIRHDRFQDDVRELIGSLRAADADQPAPEPVRRAPSPDPVPEAPASAPRTISRRTRSVIADPGIDVAASDETKQPADIEEPTVTAARASVPRILKVGLVVAAGAMALLAFGYLIGSTIIGSLG